MKIRTISILFLFAFMIPQIGICQSVKEIEGQYKETIKSIRNNNKDVKKVSVAIESDGFWYFLLTGKKEGEKIYGIANKNGEVVIPIKYYEVKYYPQENPGKFTEHFEMPNFFGPSTHETHSYLHNGSKKPIFYLRKSLYGKSMTLSDISGNILADNIELDKRTPGYWIVRGQDYNFGNNTGLLTTDGTEILPTKYSHISIGTLRDESSTNYEYEIKQINFDTYYDKITKKGAMSMDESAPFADALFNSIRIKPNYDTSKSFPWEIKKNSEDDFETFDPKKDYSVRYRDDGEKFFEKLDYTSTIGYYSHQGIDAPWAKYFAGMSCYYIAVRHELSCDALSKYYDNNQLFFIENAEPFDLDEAESLYETSLNLLNAYIASENNEPLFVKKAKIFVSTIPNSIESLPEKLNKCINAEKNFLNRQQEAERKRAIAAQKKQQEQAQQQAALIGAFFNVVAKAFTPTSSSSYSTTSKNSYSSSAGNTSSTSSSSNADKKAFWESKKRNAENTLNRYKEQLKKEPNNAAIKHNIRSQENIIQTCNEALSRY